MKFITCTIGNGMSLSDLSVNEELFKIVVVFFVGVRGLLTDCFNWDF